MHTLALFRKIGLRLLFIAALLAPSLALSAGSAAAAADMPGEVYTLTNAADGNEVLVYERAADGTLSPAGSYDTEGEGSGAGLGSQGALVLSRNNRWLVAVNAGSDEVTIFAVQPDGLEFIDNDPSGGEMPISVTVHHHWLYVLNAGGSGNITGFEIQPDGKLTAIPGSTRPLSNDGSGAAPGPAQVSFSPDGELLVVTEKATNSIVTYQVGEDGLASGPTVHASSGTTPFGFAFGKRGILIVSEANGAPDGSAVSSYIATEDDFQVVSPSAPTHQAAACWVVVTRNGKYAYDTNAGSGTISGFRVARDGSLTLLDEDGRTGVIGDGSSPTDMALNRSSRYLYALAGGTHEIAAFRVGSDGSLEAIPGVEVPAGAVGLAAR